jgi:hypothetical protein
MAVMLTPMMTTMMMLTQLRELTPAVGASELASFARRLEQQEATVGGW